MSRRLLPFALTATAAAQLASADVPNVVADIAPVHSLVARVMEGVGSPSLIIDQSGSPHEYILRPSEAEAIQNAQLIFWVGDGLTPWLDDALGTLGRDALITQLSAVAGTQVLPKRGGVHFEAHDHAGHEDHDHDHNDNEVADNHDDGDPHLWLSPENAVTWMGVIAESLAALDPENAATYRSNAEKALSELSELRSDIEATLAPVRSAPFIVFHDAYQYFERAFDVQAAGAISLSDATPPSPARIAEIRQIVQDKEVRCVMAEPQFNPDIVAVVTEGAGVGTAVLDPLGASIDPGPALYPELLRSLANAMAECLRN